jgi:hypothetical protein
MGAAVIFGGYLLGLPHNFGKVHHFDAILVLTMGVCFLSRAGDTFSLDELLRRRSRSKSAHSSEPSAADQLSGEYTWPIRLVQTLFALTFFAAGYSKVSHAGWRWVFSDNMAIVLAQHQHHIATEDPLVPWGNWLSTHTMLCRGIAGSSLMVELLYPVALFSRKGRYLLVPAAMAMQLGIRLLLGASFFQYMLCNIFWVNWSWLLVRLRPSREALPASVTPGAVS